MGVGTGEASALALTAPPSAPARWLSDCVRVPMVRRSAATLERRARRRAPASSGVVSGPPHCSPMGWGWSVASAGGRRPSPHPAARRRQGPTATASRTHFLGLSLPGSESGGGQPIADGRPTPVNGAHQSSDGTACPYAGGRWRAPPVAPATLPATTRGRPSPSPIVRQSAKRRPTGGGGTKPTQKAACPTREPAAPCHAARRRPLLAVQSRRYLGVSRCLPLPPRCASRRGGGHRRAPTCPRAVPAALCPAVHRCQQRRPRAAPLHLYLGAVTGPPRRPVTDMPSCRSGSRTPCRAAAPAGGGAVAPVARRVHSTIPAALSCMALRGRVRRAACPSAVPAAPCPAVRQRPPLVARPRPCPGASGCPPPPPRRVWRRGGGRRQAASRSGLRHTSPT